MERNTESLLCNIVGGCAARQYATLSKLEGANEDRRSAFDCAPIYDNTRGFAPRNLSNNAARARTDPSHARHARSQRLLRLHREQCKKIHDLVDSNAQQPEKEKYQKLSTRRANLFSE
jgi:hypothetical protein